jgi:hypothetical protein
VVVCAGAEVIEVVVLAQVGLVLDHQRVDAQDGRFAPGRKLAVVTLIKRKR